MPSPDDARRPAGAADDPPPGHLGPPDPAAPPPDEAPREAQRSWLLFWKLALTVIVLDQITKVLVQQLLPVLSSVTIIPGFLNLTHVHNMGVAFGLFNNSGLPYQSVLTTLLAVLALSGIVYYARHVQPEEWLARIGLSLILGGAIGNLIDRVRLGYVVDFVDVYWDTWHFWAFNLADAGITIGAVLVFADLLVVSRHASRPV